VNPGSIRAVLRHYARAERTNATVSIAGYDAGIRHETPEWLAANRELGEARAAVPWWLGWMKAIISRRIMRQLDYWRRTGQQDDDNDGGTP
jgi:hypothetical protein